jgi:hypothetical protein
LPLHPVVGSPKVCNQSLTLSRNQSVSHGWSPQRCKPITHKVGRISRNFGVIFPHISRRIPPHPVLSRLMQVNSETCSSWNCSNSIAIMFELHCSKFELFCSDRQVGRWFGISPPDDALANRTVVSRQRRRCWADCGAHRQSLPYQQLPSRNFVWYLLWSNDRPHIQEELSKPDACMFTFTPIHFSGLDRCLWSI